MSKIIPAIELKNVIKKFKQGSQSLEVLKGINLVVNPGEVVALVGQSGAGKSTLLQISGLLEQPSSGEIFFDGKKCSKLNDVQRTELRRDYVGFVYQYHNLLPDFNALENVMLPQLIAGVSTKLAEEKARWLLSKMKLDKRLKHRPSELSGGEQQRVAIARALANSPKLLLADEPTGNLDPKTSEIVFSELVSLVKDTGLAALIATHNFELAEKMDRKVRLQDGKIVDLQSFSRSQKVQLDMTKNFY